MTHFQIFPQVFFGSLLHMVFFAIKLWCQCCGSILTQLLSVSENFVKLASLSEEFSVMIMEKNRSVHSFDSLHWLPSAPCNLCCDKLKARYFALDKSALFQRLVCLVYLIQRSYSEGVILEIWSLIWREEELQYIFLGCSITHLLAKINAVSKQFFK